jgi:hypothetical protein
MTLNNKMYKNKSKLSHSLSKVAVRASGVWPKNTIKNQLKQNKMHLFRINCFQQIRTDPRVSHRSSKTLFDVPGRESKASGTVGAVRIASHGAAPQLGERSLVTAIFLVLTS